MERNSDHRYSIRPREKYFHAGNTKYGRQVLMGLSIPDLVAVFFDLDGHLIEIEKRRLHFLMPSESGRPPWRDDHRIEKDLATWQEELGFEPATIEIRRFRLANGIGISDYPEHFDEVLNGPDSDEKSWAQDLLPVWEAEGRFVLHWGNDYWFNRGGECLGS